MYQSFERIEIVREVSRMLGISQDDAEGIVNGATEHVIQQAEEGLCSIEEAACAVVCKLEDALGTRLQLVEF